MTSRRIPLIAATAIAIAAACSLSACTASTPQPTSSGIITPVTAPVIVDYATVSGTTVTAQVGQIVVINCGKTDCTSMQAEFDPAGTATFTPAAQDATASYNAAILPMIPGEVKVSLLQNDAAVQFTLNITK